MRFSTLVAASSLVCVTACSSGGSSGNYVPSPPPSYKVGGYVAGMLGAGLTVSYNGGPAISIARNGAFTVAQGATAGAMYNVTIVSQPGNPAQTCVVTNGSGTVGAANITSITVYCPQAVSTVAYVVGGGAYSPIFQMPPTLGTISVFTIDPTTGSLRPAQGSGVSTGPSVTSFVLAPQAPFAFAPNTAHIGTGIPLYNNDSLNEYAVDHNTGLLTAVTGSPFPQLGGVTNPIAITWTPNGKFGYINTFPPSAPPLSDFNAISQFEVNATTGSFSFGALTYVGSNPNAYAGAVAIDASGQFAYVPVSTGTSGTQIYTFGINSTTGSLTAAPGNPVNVSGNSATVVSDPTGRFAYAVAGEIWAFSINASDGTLTSIAGSPFAIGATSLSIAPSGQYAYAAEPTGIYVYSIDPTTGALSATADAPAVLSTPSYMQIDPSGQFAYAVADAGANETGVYAFSLDATTGALTLVSGSPFAASASPGNPVVVTLAN